MSTASVNRALVGGRDLHGLDRAERAHRSFGPVFHPLCTFRVGALCVERHSVWAGEIDYFRYINEVEGGINGIKLVWDECETNWEVEKGVDATSV